MVQTPAQKMSLSIVSNREKDCCVLIATDPAPQYVVPGTAIRFSSAGGIVRNTLLDASGTVVRVSRAGIYVLSVQMRANTGGLLPRYDVRLDGASLVPDGGTQRSFFAVIPMQAGQGLSVHNTGPTTFAFDGPAGSVFFDISSR